MPASVWHVSIAIFSTQTSGSPGKSANDDVIIWSTLVPSLSVLYKKAFALELKIIDIFCFIHSLIYTTPICNTMLTLTLTQSTIYNLFYIISNPQSCSRNPQSCSHKILIRNIFCNNKVIRNIFAQYTIFNLIYTIHTIIYAILIGNPNIFSYNLQ